MHAAEAVVLIGSAVLAAVSVLPGMGVAHWAIPLVSLLAGLTGALAIWAATGNGRLSAYSLCLGSFLGGWSVAAEVTRLWNSATLVAWIAGMMILAPWGALAAVPRRAARFPALEEGAGVPALPATDPEAELRAEMRRFESMLGEAGQKNVTVAELNEGRAGRELLLQLPDSGSVTLASLRECSQRCEVMLKAQPGAVQFAIGSHSGEVLMRVRERQSLAENKVLTPELRAKSIRDAFAIGIQEDGSTLKISLRELHMFIVGTTGSGKSNLINVILAQLGYCNDTIIWAIDMKGGRTMRPWLAAWAEGKTEAPVIDWVATTREEAALMMIAFLKAIDARMNSGQGGSKITPSAGTPQIVLICDETADLLGYMRGGRKAVGEEGTTNGQFIEMAETIAQKGRSEAGASIWATQRGTNDMVGSGTLKSLCKLRIALGAATENDLRYVTESRDAQRLMSAMEDIPGVGIAAVRKKSSQLTKFFLHDHVDGQCSDNGNEGCVPSCPVYRTSIEAGRYRPRLDRLTAASLGDAYARRWERSRHLVPQRAVAAVAVADVDTSDFDDIVAANDFADPEAGVNPIRIRAREILAARGQMGASPGSLLDALSREGMTIARETLSRWLAADEKAGHVHHADHGRWKYGPGSSESNAA
ncbi:MAG: hypothetical protein JWM19_840 [Actinomycetia bacterium]|nr:hypothetical protein [Actinomycetes bacterium]